MLRPPVVFPLGERLAPLKLLFRTFACHDLPAAITR
jgi:hypothetical protein